MADRVTIRVEGLAQVEKALKELGVQAAGRVTRSALNRAATPIVRDARGRVPVDTGELRRAITKRVQRQKRGSDKQTVVVGIEKPTSRRAHFVEFGTARQAAKPFLRPSLDENANTVLQIMTDAMRAGIERETLKAAAKYGTKRRR